MNKKIFIIATMIFTLFMGLQILSTTEAYHYPESRNNGKYVWAGRMNDYGCYVDTTSFYVTENSNSYKDWSQIVLLYDNDNLVKSVTQTFHWDSQYGACVGGKGIRPIKDQYSDLMTQFRTGWKYAFGYDFVN